MESAEYLKYIVSEPRTVIKENDAGTGWSDDATRALVYLERNVHMQKLNVRNIACNLVKSLLQFHNVNCINAHSTCIQLMHFASGLKAVKYEKTLMCLPELIPKEKSEDTACAFSEK